METGFFHTRGALMFLVQVKVLLVYGLMYVLVLLSASLHPDPSVINSIGSASHVGLCLAVTVGYAVNLIISSLKH